MCERHETVIVGGGQAGLAMNHRLGRPGRPHVILERGRVAERWRTQRWDSLMFQFPNWSLRRSSVLCRVGDDAAHLAEHMASRASAPAARRV
jgi:cation diffusion facilitator CzcD-associated flavoprotein CzcO